MMEIKARHIRPGMIIIDDKTKCLVLSIDRFYYHVLIEVDDGKIQYEIMADTDEIFELSKSGFTKQLDLFDLMKGND